MKNIIKALEAQENKRLNEFVADINKMKTHADLDKWQYNNLLPKGKKLTGTLKENIAYLIERKTKKIAIGLHEEITHVKIVFEAPTLISAKITVEWNRNRTWGMCPAGELWVQFKDKSGINSEYFKTGGITGCGYDKLSTAAAQLLNQSNHVLKPLYLLKEKHIKKDNRDLIGYGSGYGIVPKFEGGVGISCYPRIFDKVGYKFETLASGKTFDVFTITKK